MKSFFLPQGKQYNYSPVIFRFRLIKTKWNTTLWDVKLSRLKPSLDALAVIAGSIDLLSSGLKCFLRDTRPICPEILSFVLLCRAQLTYWNKRCSTKLKKTAGHAVSLRGWITVLSETHRPHVRKPISTPETNSTFPVWWSALVQSMRLCFLHLLK